MVNHTYVFDKRCPFWMDFHKCTVNIHNTYCAYAPDCPLFHRALLFPFHLVTFVFRPTLVVVSGQVRATGSGAICVCGKRKGINLKFPPKYVLLNSYSCLNTSCCCSSLLINVNDDLNVPVVFYPC